MGAGHGFQIPGDLALSADKTQFLVVSGAALADMQIRRGLEVWKGSWVYDPAKGLPMLQELAAKNPDLRVVSQIFREFFLSCGGVQSVESVSCELISTPDANGNPERALQVSFSITAEDGETLTESLAVELGS